MGNELCNAAEQTQFKKRIYNLCGPGENKLAQENLKPIQFSQNGSPKDNIYIYKQDDIKQNSVDGFSATVSDNQLFIKKQQKTLSLIKQQSNQTSHTIDPTKIKLVVSDDKSEATSPMRKAKIDLNQIYLKHVKSNNQQGNLNYQPISVPFSVIKMLLNKNLLNLLMQQQKILEKYNKNQNQFKLYKGGWYGNIIGQNFGIFLNKEYCYEGYFVENQGEFKPNNNGTYITEKGKYTGEFKDGKPNGKGKYNEFLNDSQKKVTSYEGQWQNGMLTKGTIENYIFKYEGNLLNRKPQGQGKMYFKQSKSSFSGEFKNGVFHGQHCIYETPGYSYAGDFANGKKNGKGVLLQKSALLQSSKGCAKNSQRYEGIWKQDRLQELTSAKTPN